MVGNTYPYTIHDWIEDIELASSQSIDGFILNVGKEDWQKARVADCFSAASRIHVQFKLMLSFDMSSIPAGSPEDIGLICDYFHSFGHDPRMFRFRDKVLVSTFAGENSLPGLLVKESIESIVGSVHFMPSFFIDPALFPRMKCLDGAFNWNGGWPLHLTHHSPRHKIERCELDSDKTYLHHLVGSTYMAAVSPWFFTHYGPDSWNKNWIYHSDDWLFARRWEQLVSMRDQIDIVQVISWNDYGESHYIGPIKGAQPNSQAWVDGFSHEPWLYLNRYFATWFKEGHPPKITKDQIFMWARPHPKYAHSRESVPRPNNWELVEDKFWVIVFAKEPAKVKLYTDESTRKTQHVKAGVSKLFLELEPDKGMRAVMKRNGVIVAECNPRSFRFSSQPDRQRITLMPSLQCLGNCTQ
ncbi:glycoside hydrolase family 71 protein [Pluteus cervinus]|uniref:Glycoside hydrolase family 71 protein n=1 Tax=Pluteus cervinus TaxID=181527 RepID=A0ACD3BAI4_9AGAR|nr:glycoside hydrolase family 71 protein [Pluteus cervinus]